MSLPSAPEDLTPDSQRGLAAAQLAQNGVSATLAGLFEGLSEQTSSDGRPRCPPKAVDALKRAILCRHWAPLTLELGQLFELLARACPDEPGVALRLFYVEECLSAESLGQALEAAGLPEGARLEGGQLHCGAAQQDFCLNLRRLPIWLGLLELLVYIDPGLITALAPGRTASDWARLLQATLNAFLAEHLQPKQWQQRAYRVLQWLDEAAPGQAPEMAIDDQRVLDFWLRVDPEEDFRRFRSVADVFIYLRRALALGDRQQSAQHTMALDEIEGWLALEPEQAESLDEDRLDGAALTRHPKFLTAKSWQDCELPVRHQGLIDAMPLTLIRMQVFGDHQARLIEASKRRRDFDWESLELEGYGAWLERLEGHRQGAAQAARAAVDVLLQLQQPLEAIAALSDWQANLLQGGEEAMLGALADASDQGLKRLRLQYPTLNRALDDCAKAFKQVNRSGFKGGEDFAEAEVYLDGLACLRAIDRVLARFLGCFVATSEKYSADLPMFRERFQQLHGVER
ncbi:hypothetical protein [Wenzhouxiangella marina]|uniref:Uncharacterized protein n=1 Tax=Wenzhouxiangella marina TaxID=1579979 RepID=A0A0K0XV04_9GAMM|nr:hypothetical protein [Wenzhouxiangella marina]AKS41451.1 hypothetical protein WM2015_1075 [Wenzhouxiangella marina]MBB6086794.1 hypothetical protein [Wenzhouxiangella marina]